jgi:hypothetical protein
MDCPIKARKCRMTAINVIQEKEKMIRRLQARDRRSREKINTLENIIFQIKENNLASESACNLLLVCCKDITRFLFKLFSF